MEKTNVVKLYIEDGVLIQVVKNKKNANFVISSKMGNVRLNKNSDEAIAQYLNDICIPSDSSGFKYLFMAIVIVIEKLYNRSSYSLVKDIYPIISKNFGVKERSVEDGIRSAVKRSCESISKLTTKEIIDNYVCYFK